MRKISEVQFASHGDPVAWQSRRSPFILIRSDGTVEADHTLTGKRRLLAAAEEPGSQLPLPWVGQHSTDVFIVDDYVRAERGLR